MQNVVSIIVPVYNVEKYLPTCVESVINQTSPLWELILVDDGSSDSSGRICDGYSQGNPKIKVFHKKNGGVSSARNLGIKKASGKWLTFLDSDDWFEEKAIEFILENVGNVDILRFGMKKIYNNAEVVVHIHSTESHSEYMKQVVAYEGILGVCGGVYRKDIFESGKIFFDESLKKAEDWKVLFSLTKIAKNIRVVDAPLYLYNKTNEKSCTSSISYEKEFDSLSVFCFIRDNVDYHVAGIEGSLQKARMKLYHKMIGMIAIIEGKHFIKSFCLVRKTKKMLGSVTLRNVWKKDASFLEKFVDSLSLHFATFPFFLMLYVLKYGRKNRLLGRDI